MLDYHEHAIGGGADARAVAYLELRIGERRLFGVGIDADIVTASLKAVLSGCSARRRCRPEVAASRLTSPLAQEQHHEPTS